MTATLLHNRHHRQTEKGILQSKRTQVNREHSQTNKKRGKFSSVQKKQVTENCNFPQADENLFTKALIRSS
jgi:hypothetical protein